ncbi:MAG TPA: MBL fold metallo-hydrolase, partial [Bacillota bacterium]|nr:MBL fold metallo-hydrolase [Bacillota bacterium]
RNYERSRQEYFQGLEGVDCRELSCGQIFLTAVGTLQVVHTPGHTLGHCCFYAAEKQLLFSGDHLLAKVWPNPLLEEDHQGKRYRSYVAYLESLKRVNGLRIEQVFPGHGPAFAGISEVMKRFQAYHWERERRVLNCLNKKGQTPYQITAQLYPEARELNLFLTLSKVWGYLDALTVQGLVKEGSDQGVITYCKIF